MTDTGELRYKLSRIFTKNEVGLFASTTKEHLIYHEDIGMWCIERTERTFNGATTTKVYAEIEGLNYSDIFETCESCEMKALLKIYGTSECYQVLISIQTNDNCLKRKHTMALFDEEIIANECLRNETLLKAANIIRPWWVGLMEIRRCRKKLQKLRRTAIMTRLQISMSLLYRKLKANNADLGRIEVGTS